MKISRRALLQLAASGLATTAVCGSVAVVGAKNLTRPPGALVEEEFLARCSRCLRCLDVCQPLAIRPGHWTDGPRNLGTPVMETAKCIRCMECIRYCPTGALSRIPKDEVLLGTLVLVRDVCFAWQKTRRCEICFKACPRKAFTLQDRRYPVLDMKKCDACGLCIRRCPSPGSLVLSSEGAKRYQPQPGHIITRLDDRVGPYEVAPAPYTEWLANRLRSLAQRYGLTK